MKQSDIFVWDKCEIIVNKKLYSEPHMDLHKLRNLDIVYLVYSYIWFDFSVDPVDRITVSMWNVLVVVQIEFPQVWRVWTQSWSQNSTAALCNTAVRQPTETERKYTSSSMSESISAIKWNNNCEKTHGLHN